MLDHIYPARKEHGWMPIIWLMYLIFFFVDPFTQSQHARWCGPEPSSAVQLSSCSTCTRSTRRGGVQWSSTVVMVAMGILCSPWNSGAVGFFIYAAAAAAWIDQSRKLWLWLSSDSRHHFAGELAASPAAGVRPDDVVFCINDGRGQLLLRAEEVRRSRSCNWRRMKSSIWPRSPNASASRATCMICWGIRFRSSR